MRKIKFVVFIFIFTASLFSAIEETESLQNFLYGEAPSCTDDNNQTADPGDDENVAFNYGWKYSS